MPALTLDLGNPAMQIRGAGATMEFSTPGAGLEIKVERHPDGSLINVWAQRGIASSDNLYWRFLDGMLEVSDNFHDAAAQVSPERREIDPIALVDHFLFRTVPGERTYLTGICRLGAGSQLSWRPGESPIIREPSSLHAERSYNFLEDIEDFLIKEIKPIAMQPITNMLSGGVDSTLIQSFLGESSTSISATIDSPEFSVETEYALKASSLVGSRHHFVHVSEASWLGDVVEAISALGLPAHHLQTALIHRIFDAPFTRFMVGQCADALFGLRVGIKSNVPRWTRPGLKQFIKSNVPMVLLDPIRQAQLRPFRCAPTDPVSFAANFACYSDPDLMLRVFGSTSVQASLLRRIDYTIGRIGPEIPKGIDGQLHVGHWIDFYCEDTLSLWRQLGFGRNKELAAPFGTAAAARIALSIPAGRRYVSGGRVKYLLKDLLRHRVPDYDVDQPKGHGGLPQHRFAGEGVFASMANLYPTPPYVDEVSLALSSDASGQRFADTRWNLFTLSVWHHAIVANHQLRRHQTSHHFEFD
jgi:Asparagine synthase